MGQTRRLIRDLPSHGLDVLAISGKGLVERGGLNYTLVCELLVRRRIDDKAGRGTFPPRRSRSLAGGFEEVAFWVSRYVIARNLLSFLSGLDYSKLLLSNVHAPFELFAHGGIFGVEAGRKACETDFLQRETSAPFRRQLSAGNGTRGARCHVVGKVEAGRSVTGTWDVRRCRLLLNDDFGDLWSSTPEDQK